MHRSSALGKFLFGSLTASTFGLGCWQTARFLEEKPESRVLQISPKTLDVNRPIWVGPRSGGPHKKTGYYAYLPSPDDHALVCIGWTPKMLSDLSTLRQDLIQDKKVEAVVRKGEPGNRFSPPNPPNGPFLWMDETQMLKAAGFTSVEEACVAETHEPVLNNRNGASILFFPKEKSQPYLTKWTHAGYAVTWYSLSIAGILMMRRMF